MTRTPSVSEPQATVPGTVTRRHGGATAAVAPGPQTRLAARTRPHGHGEVGPFPGGARARGTEHRLGLGRAAPVSGSGSISEPGGLNMLK